MISKKYTAETIQYRNLFESLTGARVKDCFSNDKIIFVIEKGDINRAVGRNGETIRRAENIFKRQLKIIEFDDDLIKFVKNAIMPIKALDIKLEDNNIIITADSMTDKGRLIGRDSKNLIKLKELISNYFSINNVKVK